MGSSSVDAAAKEMSWDKSANLDVHVLRFSSLCSGLEMQQPCAQIQQPCQCFAIGLPCLGTVANMHLIHDQSMLSPCRTAF